MSKRARVLYDYDAQDSDQLSIKAGQLIEVKGAATAEGWVLAKCKGQEGYIPAQYIEEMAGGPPPKPPGGGGGITMPSTRGSVNKSKPPANNNLKKPPPSSGGRGAGNSVFGGRKESSSTPLKSDDAYSIFAYYMEWFGVIGMFLSGLFAFMYGTIIIDPEGTIAMAFGFTSMLCSSILAALMTIGRDRINCCMQSPSLSRGMLFFCCALVSGGGYPIGILGGSTLCCACLTDLLAHQKDASPAVTSANWAEFCTDCISCYTPWRIVFGLLFVAADAGVFIFGYLNGTTFANVASLTNQVELDPLSWGMAEGFGTVISFNMAVIFIFALFGLQKWLLDRAAGNPNCCNNAIGWFVDPEAQIFLHTFVAISLVVAVFLHMIANFAAFENSGPYRSYLQLFGMVPLVTGMVAFVLLSILMAGAHKDIKRNLAKLFRGTHIIAVFLAILLLFHGPGGFGRNFWKWIAGPLSLYLVDVLFRAGWISNSQ